MKVYVIPRERSDVILSEAKNLLYVQQILREACTERSECAQDDTIARDDS
jgi:hypothetical protein